MSIFGEPEIPKLSFPKFYFQTTPYNRIYLKKIRLFYHLQSTTRDCKKPDILTAFTSDHSPLIFTLSCVKSVRIRSYSGPYFPAFGLNAERYSVCFRIQSKMRENTDQNNSKCRHFLCSVKHESRWSEMNRSMKIQ